MSVPTAAINSTFRRPLLDVYINGQRAAECTGVETTCGLTQINATATIHGVERPDGAEEIQSCAIWAGLQTSDGSGTEIIFRGEISGFDWRSWPDDVSPVARDKFARLRQNWGGEDREYTSQDDDAVIRNLAEAMGFASSEMNIEASDWGALGAWTLGVVEPVVARNGQPFIQLISRIDNLAGMKTFVDPAGNLLRRRVRGDIGSGSIWEFEEGDDIISCERQRRVEGIANQCVVTGLEYEGLLVGGPGVAEVRAENPFISDPPRYVGDPINDDLIEDDDRALAIAKRQVADHNRRPDGARITVPFNPKVRPGSVVKITHSALELSSGSRFLVDQVKHTVIFWPFQPPRTEITTFGGPLVAAEINIPPVASFAVQLVQEAADTGSGAVSRIIVRADGSTSYDPDGTTLTYAWTFAVDAGSVSPSSPTAAVVMAVISGATTTLNVTLTVTDADGATNTMGPQTFSLSRDQLQVEPLYLAWADGVIEASKDGELTWNASTAGAGATCTPPFAPAWGTIWGGDNGHIYMSTDYLATAAVDTGAPGGGAIDVTAVWIHEVETTRAWAGMSNGAVYSGVVDTTTPTIAWTLAGTIPASPVYRIREAIGALGSLRATAGTGYYGSEDGGATWTLIHAFTASNALAMAAGFDENLVSGHNVSSGAVVYAESGTQPTTPGGVDTATMTFGWRTQALYAADDVDPANLYATDSTFAALTDTTDNAPDATNDMIRSGGIDGVVYLACDTGPAKWLPGVAAPFFIRQRAAKRCLQIGYGPIQLPAVAIDFVFATYGITGTWDGLHRYNFGVWSKITPPHTAWNWVQLVAHPYNRNRWLLLGFPQADTIFTATKSGGAVKSVTGGFSPLWLTDDAGATWQQVTLPATALTGAGIAIYAIGWQEQSGRWFVSGQDLADSTAAFWYGSTTTDGVAHKPTGGSAFQNVYWGISGMGGDFLFAEEDSPGGGTAGRLVYIPNDGTTWAGETWKTDPGGWSQPRGPIDVIKGEREFWQINTAVAGIAHWTDYRETDPASNNGPPPTRANDVNGAYAYVAVGAEHVYFAGNVASHVGFHRRTHASWQPVTVPEYPIASGTAYLCVTDRQSRRLFVGWASVSGTFQFIIHDGSAWAAIATPDSSLSSGGGAIYKDGRGVAIAPLGQVALV